MFSAFQTFGRLGAGARAVAAAWSPSALWPTGTEAGMWIDPSNLTSQWQDSTGTTPVATPGTVADSSNPVGLALDIRAGATALSDPGNHMLQATSAARPLLSSRVNLLVATATLSTQSVTVTAIPHTITFSGGGTVTASGAYVGVLTSGQTFTPTAGTLTLTVAGSVTSAMLNRGSTALTYQPVVSASSYTSTGFPIAQLYDGTDDGMATASFAAGTLINGMDCMIAVRRDSASTTLVAGLYYQPGTSWTGLSSLDYPTAPVAGNAGSPAVWVDGVQLSGGTSVTAGTLHTALTTGSWHILEMRGLDLSTWTSLKYGDYVTAMLNGARGDIMLYPSTASTEDKDAARQYLADKYGVTLP